MVLGRITSRLSRTVATQCRSSVLASRQNQHHFPIISNQFHSLVNPHTKVVRDQQFLFSNSVRNSSTTTTTTTTITTTTTTKPYSQNVLNSSTFQKFRISSSASPEPNDGANSAEQNDKSSVDPAAEGSNKQGSGSISEPHTIKAESIKRIKSSKRTAFSDSDSDEENLSKDDLVKLVAEKEELLKTKQTELQQMQDRVLRTYAEMENVRERAKREVDNSNKFGIQSFAKNLLDVADNLGRASSVVKTSFAKIDTSVDTAGAVPLLKTLLEGVEMTDKQLAAVFKKFGVEKFDPTNEQFDPNRHNAQFQVPDPSKPNGTVAVVLKPGYSLHERIIRPAEVGVVENAS